VLLINLTKTKTIKINSIISIYKRERRERDRY